jgi:hypothetical protein
MDSQSNPVGSSTRSYKRRQVEHDVPAYKRVLVCDTRNQRYAKQSQTRDRSHRPRSSAIIDISGKNALAVDVGETIVDKRESQP